MWSRAQLLLVYKEVLPVTMRIAAILLCLWVTPVLAETQGGPVHTILTVAKEKLDVDVTWLQTGGVVLLKIVSTKQVPAEKREATLAAARKLLAGKSGGKVMISDAGKLVGSYRLTGWNKPFTARDIKASP